MPLVAHIQLVITILLITSSNKKAFCFLHIVFYKLLAISSSLNTQELGVLDTSTVENTSVTFDFTAAICIHRFNHMQSKQQLPLASGYLLLGICCGNAKILFLICSWLNLDLKICRYKKGQLCLLKKKKMYMWSHNVP